jgi:carboxymethylenebutenolidase
MERSRPAHGFHAPDDRFPYLEHSLQTKRRIVFAAAVLALSAFLGERAMAVGRDLGFTSGGTRIAVERFDAAGGGRRPAILLLHGADGFTRGDERYRLGAQVLAAAGYHVFLPHYLERTGQARAAHSTIGRNFPLWRETVADALDFVERQPGVDPKRIGIVGTSLGGALGVTLAAADRRVRALVNYFGFLPETLPEKASRLPPTLVLHGARDAIVPVANAHALEALLQRLRVPHEVHVYPDQAHGFHGAAQLDAAQRTAAFLNRHLGSGAAALAPEAVPSEAD